MDPLILTVAVAVFGAVGFVALNHPGLYEWLYWRLLWALFLVVVAAVIWNFSAAMAAKAASLAAPASIAEKVNSAGQNFSITNWLFWALSAAFFIWLVILFSLSLKLKEMNAKPR